jgi:dipeptidyl aminopeptidase/acylaminoacyl peptidase
MKKMRAVGIVLAWAGMVAGLGMGAAQTAGQAAANPTHDGETVMNGAPKRAMTLADLMAMKRVSDPQVSPSGRWVMFSVTDVSLEKNTKVNHLWVVPIAGDTGVPAADVKPYDMGRTTGERQMTFGDGESFGRFSPDGKWVSMTIKGQIVLAPWNEEQGRVGEGDHVNMVRLTNVAGGADGAIWSPDSRHFLFTTQVYPGCSNKPTWVEEDACDKAKDDAAEKSPVKAQVWDALLYRHWDAYTGKKRTHILVVDADGKNLRDLTPASAVGDAETPTWFLGAPLQYAWAPDSKEIAYVTNLDPVPAASTNNDVFTLRLDEPGAKAVKVSTSLGSDDEPEYSPDGKWLAFRSQARNGFESDLFRLVVMDRASGKINSNVMPGYTDQQRKVVGDNWVDEFAWSPDSKHIAFASPDRGRETVRVISVVPSSGPPSDWLAVDGELGSLGFASDGAVVATRMYVNRPTEIVLLKHTEAIEKGYDIISSNTDISSITHLNNGLLSQLDLAKLEPFWFAGAEGTQVEGFLIKPPGFDPAKKYPVKFVMHGGPQTALGDSWSYRWNWELLAADGYVVVGINRRGSTGYGQKFVDEVSGDWGGRAYQDLMKGLDYAEAHYPFIDKTRECALGASYGGFMADWVLTHTNRFQCIVTHDGMADPVSAYGSTEEMWFNEWEFRRPEDFPKGWDGFSAGYDPMGKPAKATTEILTGGQNDGQNAGILRSAQNDKQKSEVSQGSGHPAEPWRYQNLPAEQDPFRRWSPMRFIENAKTPTLIIHSQRDYRLDVSQGFELYTALERRGVPARFLYFPDEGHWVLKPQNSQLWYETVDDWCDRWTKTGKYAEK